MGHRSSLLNFGEVTGFKLGTALWGRPVMDVICYFVDGILIDTSASNNRQRLVSLLEDKIFDRVFLTHYHEDHAGNAAYLQKNRHVKVFGHANTQASLSKKVKLKPYEYYMWGGLESLKIDVLPEVFETENYKFYPIHTPGHSWDHVVYHEPHQGWIFSGDMFLGPKVKYFRKDECIYETICSLHKISKLNYEHLYCGHNPKLKNANQYILKKLSFLVEIYTKTEEAFHKGVPDKLIISDLIEDREHLLAQLFTLGDVSYKNLILSALKSLRQNKTIRNM